MCKKIAPLTKERQELVECNINHAYWLAHQWARRTSIIDTDEFISMALYGLTKAAATYDPSKSTQFNTYSRFVIENEFKNELKKVQRCSVGVYDTDIDTNENEEADTGDIEAGIDLIRAIASLPELNQLIVLEFYQEGFNQYEIAEKHGISQTKVSVILKKSKELIAQSMNL